MGPFKCPDCGIWWAGYEHRCSIDLTKVRWPSVTITSPNIVSTTVRCTCPPDRGDNYAGSCPIHDVHTTYTVPTS